MKICREIQFKLRSGFAKALGSRGQKAGFGEGWQEHPERDVIFGSTPGTVVPPKNRAPPAILPSRFPARLPRVRAFAAGSENEIESNRKL